jgi:hypothetical protein
MRGAGVVQATRNSWVRRMTATEVSSRPFAVKKLAADCAGGFVRSQCSPASDGPAGVVGDPDDPAQKAAGGPCCARMGQPIAGWPRLEVSTLPHPSHGAGPRKADMHNGCRIREQNRVYTPDAFTPLNMRHSFNEQPPNQKHYQRGTYPPTPTHVLGSYPSTPTRVDGLQWQ